jgi:hypothetical protein
MESQQCCHLLTFTDSVINSIQSIYFVNEVEHCKPTLRNIFLAHSEEHGVSMTLSLSLASRSRSMESLLNAFIDMNGWHDFYQSVIKRLSIVLALLGNDTLRLTVELSLECNTCVPHQCEYGGIAV